MTHGARRTHDARTTIYTNYSPFILQKFIMPYHKKRKTDRPPQGQVPKLEIKAAVAALLVGWTVYSVAKDTGINAMTLKR